MLRSDPEHISTTYGINRQPALNSLKYFHVADGLAPDVMHDLLEGAVKMEVKALLQVYTMDKKYFTIEQFNTRLSLFMYIYHCSIIHILVQVCTYVQYGSWAHKH